MSCLDLDLHHVLGGLAVGLCAHDVEHGRRLLGRRLDQRDLRLAVPATKALDKNIKKYGKRINVC